MELHYQVSLSNLTQVSSNRFTNLVGFLPNSGMGHKKRPKFHLENVFHCNLNIFMNFSDVSTETCTEVPLKESLLSMLLTFHHFRFLHIVFHLLAVGLSLFPIISVLCG